MSGIRALIKETPESSLILWPVRLPREDEPSVNQEEGSHQTMCHPDLGLPASRTVRNTFLLFISHPPYSTFFYISPNGQRHTL